MRGVHRVVQHDCITKKEQKTSRKHRTLTDNPVDLSLSLSLLPDVSCGAKNVDDLAKTKFRPRTKPAVASLITHFEKSSTPFSCMRFRWLHQRLSSFCTYTPLDAEIILSLKVGKDYKYDRAPSTGHSHHSRCFSQRLPSLFSLSSVDHSLLNVRKSPHKSLSIFLK